MAAVHAFDFLAEESHPPIPPLCVLFGDEPFLRALVLAQLRQAVLSDEDAEFGLTRFDGRTVQWRTVSDELLTVGLFGGGERLVVVDDADDFVSENRGHLEDYVARPSRTGRLVLAVESWPSNTRLAKHTVANGLAVECKSPPAAKLLKWLGTLARERHGARLERDAAELLLEIIGPELGLIDQELAKLAAAAGEAPIGAELVQQLVGGWRAKTAWDMLDAAVEGRTSQALVELDRLLLSGENPIAILAQIAATLRRFAAATRLIRQSEASGARPNVRQALELAGVKPFVVQKTEAQLRRLGRERAGEIYRWLLEADQALKGTSSSPARARTVLEQLVARLGAAEGRKQASAR
ncbi:MAG TPA: DNA polymerase III subunit delta [Pirellulales bacterium]|jgi:DNA polymerase-3 subunit delta|nr:DNA polymerase III subunit delta [Pirellulales bacterium]